MRSVIAAAILLVGSVGAAQAQGTGALTREDVQALRAAAEATAKSTRETVDYVRVTPDILHQILAKLDKIETKLDKLENLQRSASSRGRTR
jgi:hypothetical protein